MLRQPAPGDDAQVRRVSDLLAPGRRVWFAADRPSLTAVRERVLYVAARDVLPERGADGRTWRSDLVRYLPGVLPGAELHRSIGHWNQPAQLEAFQVLEGRIGLFISTPGGPVHYTVAAAGDTVALPLSAWHLTYVISDGAMVFNVYADGAASDEADKYASREPVRHWLRAAAGQPVPQSPPGCEPAVGRPAAVWRPETSSGGSCLAAGLAGTQARAGRLLAAVRSAIERSGAVGDGGAQPGRLGPAGRGGGGGKAAVGRVPIRLNSEPGDDIDGQMRK
jgi:oxalate decarboxylase/phosphoglucose isomerase-like protein (cupin superfamily)